MMVAVVEAGTGTQAAIDGYTVAGKTGTARKPQANGTYQDAAGNYHYVTTFAGFVPAQDPQLSIIVVIDEPARTATTPARWRRRCSPSSPATRLRQFRIPPPADAVPAERAGTDRRRDADRRRRRHRRRRGRPGPQRGRRPHDHHDDRTGGIRQRRTTVPGNGAPDPPDTG